MLLRKAPATLPPASSTMKPTSSSRKRPIMVHPPVPGETHPFYGDAHNRTLLLPSLQIHTPPSPADIKRRQDVFKAAEKGDLMFLQRILEDAERDSATVDVDVASSGGLTPLHVAASRGHLHMVQALIDQCGATVDVVDTDGETALLKAAFHGHVPVVQCLLQRRTNVQHRDKDGWSALHNACAKGWEKVVLMLVEVGGADVNARSKTGHTPLMNAASKGFLDIVAYLLSRPETDPLVQDARGDTAYDAAATHLFSDVCDVIENAEREWWVQPHGEVRHFTGAYDPVAVHNTVLVTLHENQRAAVTFQTLLGTQPPKFTAQALARSDRRAPWTRPPSHVACMQSQVALPVDPYGKRIWFWLTEWQIDPHRLEGHDMEEEMEEEAGWEYARSFDDVEWFTAPVASSGGVRRRRWIRVMKRNVEIEGMASAETLSMQGVATGMDPREFLQPAKVLGSSGGLSRMDVLEHVSASPTMAAASRRRQSVSLGRRKMSMSGGMEDAEPLRLRGAGDEAWLSRRLSKRDENAVKAGYAKYYGIVSEGRAVLRLRGGGPEDGDTSIESRPTNFLPETPPSTAMHSSLLTEQLERSKRVMSEPPMVLHDVVSSPAMSVQIASAASRASSIPEWQQECDRILRPFSMPPPIDILRSGTPPRRIAEDVNSSNPHTPGTHLDATEDSASERGEENEPGTTRDVMVEAQSRRRASTNFGTLTADDFVSSAAVSAASSSLPARIVHTSTSNPGSSFFSSLFGTYDANVSRTRRSSESRRRGDSEASVSGNPSTMSPQMAIRYVEAMDPENWELDQDAPDCRGCRRKFTVWFRRHHCRCTSRRSLLLPYESTDSDSSTRQRRRLTYQRVCEVCYQSINAMTPNAPLSPEIAPRRRRRNSEASIMLDCPVCGLHLDELGTDRSVQEHHVKECIEELSSGNAKVAGVRYLVNRIVEPSVLIGDECPICFEEFQKGELVARLNCLCAYHRSCIDQWLSRGHYCPVHELG